MGQLTYANDYVQLPADSTGKRTGFLKWDTGGGDLLYLATSIPIDETGNTLISALSGDAVSGAVNAVSNAAFQFLYNGSTWDRVRGDTTNGIDVDVTRVSGTVTVDSELPAAAALSDTDSGTPTVPGVGSYNMVYDANAAKYTRSRSVYSTMNATGTGITAAGLVAQFDDVLPGVVTENQFAPVRMTTKRAIHVALRDSAGNDRGLAIDANGAIATTAPINVSTSAVMGSATSFAFTTDGYQSVLFYIGSGLANGNIIQFEGTIGDGVWSNIPVVFSNGEVATSYTVVAANLPRIGSFLATGFIQVRIRISTYTSGSSNVFMEGSSSGKGFADGVVGVVPNDTNDPGIYPVKVGGRYVSAPSTHTNGDAAEFLTDNKGHQYVTLATDGGLTAVSDATPADGRANSTVRALDVNAILSAYKGDGLSLDRIKMNRLQTGTAGTRTSVAVATSDTLLLAANTARIRATIHNDSTQILLIGDGATAVTATSYSHKLYPGDEYEVNDHTAQIRGIWLGADATGAARVTEVT